MDVLKTKEASAFYTTGWFKLVALVFVASALLGFMYTNSYQVTLKKNEILLSTVKQGDLAVTVEGYGKLTSNSLKLITAHSRATVEEIILKPGSHVTRDTVIVKLASPELHHALLNAEQELAQLDANLRQLRVNQQREMLIEQALLTAIEAEFETAKLRREAEYKLLEKGIVAEFTYKQTALNESQLLKRMNLFKARLSQLSHVHQEAINIQQERIKQLGGQLNIAKQRVEQLNVKAGIDGVIQHLPVQLGQSLTAGQEVALIGSMSDLIALVRVPQHQAPKLKVGQSVSVDTRSDTIAGLVSRIDPVVIDNTVEVEITLTEALSASARPEQTIDAQITIETLSNVLYIERPAKLNAHTEANLYKLEQDALLAARTSVKTGKKAGRYIEITHGASRGEQVIISDLNNYKSQHITLE